jgi:glucokinase
MTPMILAGDVGGTKTNLGLFVPRGSALRPVREATFSSPEARSLEDMVRAFLAGGRERVHACAVGVAGPVVKGRSHIVNLPWPVDEKRLAKAVGIGHARVLNDLEATAWGIPELGPRQVADLTPGRRPSPGNGALVAAGTGLGMAILFRDGERHRPAASEGGHQALAPRDGREDALVRFLRARFGRASLERAVSGPGLAAIYEFLRESGTAPESAAMRARLADGDPSAAISAAALAGEDLLAAESLDLFVSLYGAAAGDLALVVRATAGVWLAGGIAPKILPRLRTGPFLASFGDKGRLSEFVGRIPIRVVLEPRTALIGAAACIARTGASSSRR